MNNIDKQIKDSNRYDEYVVTHQLRCSSSSIDPNHDELDHEYVYN